MSFLRLPPSSKPDAMEPKGSRRERFKGIFRRSSSRSRQNPDASDLSPTTKSNSPSHTPAELTSPGKQSEETSIGLPPAIKDYDPSNIPVLVAPPGTGSQQQPVSSLKKAFDRLSATQQEQLQISLPAGSVEEELEKVQKAKEECINKRKIITLPNGQIVVVREKVQVILRKIQQYVMIVDIAIQHHPETISLVWAGIRFCLQIVLDDMETFDSITSFLEVITDIMGSCRIYENIYSPGDTRPTRIVIERVQELYKAVLDFIAEANDYFNTSSTKRMVQAMTKPFVTHFQYKINDINQRKKQLNDSAMIAHLDVQKRRTKEQLQEFEKLNDQLSLFQTNIVQIRDDLKMLLVDVEAKNRAEILEWLSPVRPGDHHEGLQRLRFEETGEWLLSKPEYEDWIGSDSSSILWLRGKAGSGKSVLCSFVKDALRGTFDESVPVVFFYCHYEEKARREAGSVLRSLLKQLSAQKQFTAVHKDLVIEHRDATEGGFISSSLSYHTTKSLLRTTISRFKTIFIVVDALDECSPKERKLLVKFLIDQIRNPEESSGCLVKIFLTSRDEMDLRRMLGGGDIENYAIEADDTAKDINPFVKKEVAGYIDSGEILGGNVSKELQEKLIESLIDNADGMFLWVKYQLLQLCDAANAQDLEVRLKTLPIGLKSTYLEIWNNIGLMDNTQKHWAYKTMTWILSATKPMKSDELLLATSIEPGDAATYDRSMKASDISYLIRVCKHLIVEDAYGYIRFMHYSVQEFVREQVEIQKLKSAVAETCLTVLGTATYIFDSIYKYACNNWHIHLTDLSNLNTHATLITAFLLDKNAFKEWWYGSSANLYYELGDYSMKWSYFQPIRIVAGFNLIDLLKCFLQAQPNSPFYVPIPNLSPLLYTACYTGSTETAQFLIELGANVNSHRGDWGTALEAAARWGKMDLLKLVLKAGADVNAQGEGDYGNALHAAAGNGKIEAMKLLFEVGADVNAQGGKYGNALQAAAKSGEIDSVTLLLKAGADVNAQGGEYGNALNAAAINCKTDVVKLLLKAGADIKAQGRLYEQRFCILQAAAFSGKVDLVKLLLEAGADINAWDEYSGNAFLIAAASGHTGIVKLLLDAGADINVQGGSHGNALHAGVHSGKIDMVKLLLKSGADVHARGKCNGISLQAAASYRKKVDIMKLLIEAGSNVNSQAGNQGSSLQQAARYNGIDAVRLLLDAGADVNAQGEFDSALLAAASAGKPHVVKLLLEEGADVNAQGGRYGSALQGASVNGQTDAAKLLLKAGANVNAQGGERGSALIAAASAGKPDLVKLLLEAGADVNYQGGKHHRNALQAVAMNGSIDTAKLLLEAGADVNALGGMDGSALQVASRLKKADLVKLLLGAGADVNAQGGEYGNALQAASTFDNDGLVKLLLEAGADVNFQGGKYGSALQAAATNHQTNAVKLLLEAGANVNNPAGEYCSALQGAARYGESDLIKLLLEAGADINARGGKYETAFQEAVSTGKVDSVKLLLEAGADINAQGGKYGTAVQMATQYYSSTELLLLLLEAGADPNIQGGYYGNCLQAAATKGIEWVNVLLDAGIDLESQLNANCGFFGNALQSAAYFGQVEVVDLFLKRGANVNAKGGEFGSALQAVVAASGRRPSNTNRQKAVFKILLEAGADLDVQGGRYENILYAAASNYGVHMHEMVNLVLNAGFDTLIQKGKYSDELKSASLGHDRVYKISQVLKEKVAGMKKDGDPSY